MKYLFFIFICLELIAADTSGIGRIVKIPSGEVDYFLVIRENDKEYYWPLIIKNKKQQELIKTNENKIVQFAGKAVMKEVMVAEQKRMLEMFHIRELSAITLKQLRIPNDIAETIANTKDPIYLKNTKDPKKIELTVNTKTVIASIITAVAVNALTSVNSGGVQPNFQQNVIGSLVLGGSLYFAGKNLINSAQIKETDWQLTP